MAAAANPARRPPHVVSAHKAAYSRGLAGEPETDEIADNPRLRASYRRGLRDARGEGKPTAAGKPADAESEPKTGEPEPVAPPAAAVTKPARRRAHVSAGGFTLGIVAYALAINGIRYGPAGIKAYASAKLFNRVLPGPWIAGSGGHVSGSAATT